MWVQNMMSIQMVGLRITLKALWVSMKWPSIGKKASQRINDHSKPQRSWKGVCFDAYPCCSGYIISPIIGGFPKSRKAHRGESKPCGPSNLHPTFKHHRWWHSYGFRGCLWVQVVTSNGTKALKVMIQDIDPSFC